MSKPVLPDQASPRHDAGGKAHAFEAPNSELVYRPMWYVRKKVVSSYHVSPVRSTDRRPWSSILGNDRSASNLLALDLYSLKRAVRDVTVLQRQGNRALIGTSVHFATLRHPDTRRLFLERCQHLDSARSKGLIIELVNLPMNFSQALVADMTSSLNRHFRAVLIQLPLRSRRFSELVFTNAYALGANIAYEADSEAVLIREINRFASAAAALGMKCYLHGIETMSLTTAAVCAGYEYINGALITSLREAPSQVFPLEPIELYRRLLQKK